MSDEMKRKQAQTAYETVCKALDNEGWKYERHDENLVLTFGAQGEDLPIEFICAVQEGAQVISVLSFLPFKIAEDKRMDAAVALTVINNRFVNGCFDMDLSTGKINFRVVSSYRGSLIGEELVTYMVYLTAQTVDKYNDKLLMISKGMMTLEQFLESENEDKSE